MFGKPEPKFKQYNKKINDNADAYLEIGDAFNADVRILRCVDSLHVREGDYRYNEYIQTIGDSRIVKKRALIFYLQIITAKNISGHNQLKKANSPVENMIYMSALNKCTMTVQFLFYHKNYKTNEFIESDVEKFRDYWQSLIPNSLNLGLSNLDLRMDMYAAINQKTQINTFLFKGRKFNANFVVNKISQMGGSDVPYIMMYGTSAQTTRYEEDRNFIYRDGIPVRFKEIVLPEGVVDENSIKYFSRK